MKPSQILFEAWKLFRGGKNWIKGRYHDSNACYCSIGAVCEAGADVSLTEVNRAKRFLYQAVGYDRVVDFNDAPTTRYIDVSRVFRRAAALARAEGQ